MLKQLLDGLFDVLLPRFGTLRMQSMLLMDVPENQSHSGLQWAWLNNHPRALCLLKPIVSVAQLLCQLESFFLCRLVWSDQQPHTLVLMFLVPQGICPVEGALNRNSQPHVMNIMAKIISFPAYIFQPSAATCLCQQRYAVSSGSRATYPVVTSSLEHLVVIPTVPITCAQL